MHDAFGDRSSVYPRSPLQSTTRPSCFKALSTRPRRLSRAATPPRRTSSPSATSRGSLATTKAGTTGTATSWRCWTTAPPRPLLRCKISNEVSPSNHITSLQGGPSITTVLILKTLRARLRFAHRPQVCQQIEVSAMIDHPVELYCTCSHIIFASFSGSTEIDMGRKIRETLLEGISSQIFRTLCNPASLKKFEVTFWSPFCTALGVYSVTMLVEYIGSLTVSLLL